VPNENRAILLGNGFSRAFSDDIFSYESLYSEAELSADIKHIFDMLQTTDFELVMRRLDDASNINRQYRFDDQASKIESDVKLIREALITVLRKRHPLSRNDLLERQALACSAFLADFREIFTLNYDLLLYWAFVRYLKEHTSHFVDGFSNEDGKLIWQHNSLKQNVFYLHGALHVYNHNHKIEKVQYTNNRIEQNLIDQIAERINKRMYPLFVSEGKSTQKLDRIYQNPYLAYAYSRLQSNDKRLTILGTTLKENDSHILAALKRSRTPGFDVYLHESMGDGERESLTHRMDQTCSAIKANIKNEVHVKYHCTSELNIWGQAV
jgi:hypothetical protein